MTRLSVLLPCYNASETLSAALASLTHQTFQDFEVVIVDDGSTDDSLRILEKYASLDHRFHIIPLPHRGLVAALQTGLHACTAPLVARMDSDDVSHPQRLEKQAAYLDQNPAISLVSCRVRGFPHESLRTGFRIYIDWLNSLLDNEVIRREIFIESPLPHPSVVYRRQAILQVGGYQDHGWAEDYDLWLRLYLQGNRFAKLPEVLLDWREHPARLTRSDSRYSLENFLRCKAHYLARGPLSGRDALIIWGAGMTGRRLSKHLLRQKLPLVGFIDIDPKKIGHTLRGFPVFAPDVLPGLWSDHAKPVLLAAVGSRGARQLIRQQLAGFGLEEADDYWCVA
jgi:glycosyltransferase involved in cell wall biosynthesis